MPRSPRLAALLAVLGALLLVLVLTERRDRRVAAEPASEQPTHRSTAAAPARWFAATAEPRLAAAGATEGLRLEGLVVDDHQRPIGGATVTLGARVVTTEADGGFAFDGLAEGVYTVTAERDGAYAESTDERLDATSDPIELELARGPSLRVHVVDDAGAPIAGARVYTSGRDVRTDVAGLAVLRAVDLERERFFVVADAYAEISVDVATGDDPDAVLEREVVLHAGTRIAGVVLDEAGQPVANATVDLAQVGGEERGEREPTDEHGEFAFVRIGRGTYRLAARSDELATGPAVEVPLDGVTPARVVVRAVLGAELTGVVVDLQGRPVANAEVEISGRWTHSDADGTFTVRGLEPTDALEVGAHTPTLGMQTQVMKLGAREHLRVRLVLAPTSIAGVVVDPDGQPIEGATVYARSEDPLGFAFTLSDARGRFDLGGVPLGTYTLSATREDSRHEGLEQVATTGDRGVRLVLPGVATLTGTVALDGVPVRYFGYELLSPGDDMAWSPTAVRDAAGGCTLQDAPPGAWNVAIVGPGFATRILRGVQIAGGRVTELGTIRVERGRSLRGRVVDAHGATVAGATVRVRGDDTDDDLVGLRAIARRVLTTRTAADGTYRLDGLGPPEDGARVFATKAGVGAAEVELGADAVVDLTLLTVP